MKVLIATQKPFAAAAVAGIKEILEKGGYEVQLLEKYAEQADLVKAVADVNALIIRSDKVTAEVLDAAKELKIVVRAGAGYDNVDLAAATAHGVVVMNTPGQNSNAVAELAIAMMIFMARTQFTPATGSEVQGKTLGIQAFGNVGRLVGAKAKALGMKVKALDPFLSDEQIATKVHSQLALRNQYYAEAKIKFDSTLIETADETVLTAARLAKVVLEALDGREFGD